MSNLIVIVGLIGITTASTFIPIVFLAPSLSSSVATSDKFDSKKLNCEAMMDVGEVVGEGWQCIDEQR